MNQKNPVLKSVMIFTFVMALITLVYMLISVFSNRNSQIVIDTETMKLVQLEEPEEGDPIAIVETSLGEFRFVLYPEYSPNAVNNFIELAESGHYNNTYVFHSEESAYAGIGAPNKDGTMPDGYDESRELIERELHQDLWPFKGAVCCMTTTVDRGLKEMIFGGGTYYCGSRLALINSIEFTDDVKNELLASSEDTTLAEAFIEKGGIPNFSQQMTVIGQTYEGIEIVEALTSLETEDSDSYKIPKEDIMIVSVEISEYSEEEKASPENK